MARDQLAAQMTHRPSTQDSFYLLNQRQKDAVKLTDVIGRTMRGQPVVRILLLDVDMGGSNLSIYIRLNQSTTTVVKLVSY
jgi:hypothetical protein